MDNEVKANNGKGLFDNLGMIDTLIEDLNALPKDLIDGQNVRFCARISCMGQKLANLKEGVKNDIECLQKQLAELQRFVDDINAAEGGKTDV